MARVAFEATPPSGAPSTIGSSGCGAAAGARAAAGGTRPPCASRASGGGLARLGAARWNSPQGARPAARDHPLRPAARGLRRGPGAVEQVAPLHDQRHRLQPDADPSRDQPGGGRLHRPSLVEVDISAAAPSRSGPKGSSTALARPGARPRQRRGVLREGAVHARGSPRAAMPVVFTSRCSRRCARRRPPSRPPRRLSRPRRARGTTSRRPPRSGWTSRSARSRGGSPSTGTPSRTSFRPACWTTCSPPSRPSCAP